MKSKYIFSFRVLCIFAMIAGIASLSACSQYPGTGFITAGDYAYAQNECKERDGIANVTADGNRLARRDDESYGTLRIHCNNGESITVGKWKD